MYKCKGCQWYNKPYWSIINPCDNCPRENTNVEIITRWQDPTIEELKTQLQQKENVIKEVRGKLLKLNDKFKLVSGIPINISEIMEMIEILDKSDKNE